MRITVIWSPSEYVYTIHTNNVLVLIKIKYEYKQKYEEDQGKIFQEIPVKKYETGYTRERSVPMSFFPKLTGQEEETGIIQLPPSSGGNK